MTIPDAMPTLSGGGHPTNNGYACIMEYISLLAGEEWSDHPQCTDPAVAGLARWVNDSLADQHRHRLIPYIGRIMACKPYGSNPDDRDEIDMAMAMAKTGVSVPHIFVTACFCPMCNTQIGRQSEIADYLMEVLDAGLDAYDKIAGKPEVKEVTKSQLRWLKEAVSV